LHPAGGKELSGSGVIHNPFPRSLPATEGKVIFVDLNTVVILVIGVATLVVGIVGLMVKLIELGRK